MYIKYIPTGAKNNWLLTSQIRLSWKRKLQLLIGHCPHAHMQHSCNYWCVILQREKQLLWEPGELWARLHWPLQGSVFAQESGSWRGPSSSSSPWPQCVAAGTRVLGAIQRLGWAWAGIKPLPPSSSPQSPGPAASMSDHALNKCIGAGFILFCFHQTGKCARFFFLYLRGNQLATSMFA